MIGRRRLITVLQTLDLVCNAGRAPHPQFQCVMLGANIGSCPLLMSIWALLYFILRSTLER